MSVRIACWLVLLAWAGWAQPSSPRLMKAEVEALLREFALLGPRPYSSQWPNGNPKEKLEKAADGTLSFTRFFPTGGYAVRYQRKPGKVIKLERYYGNGKTSILLNRDERITDFTSYWENGNKKAKYQENRHTRKIFYDARDIDGKQVYPPVR